MRAWLQCFADGGIEFRQLLQAFIDQCLSAILRDAFEIPPQDQGAIDLIVVIVRLVIDSLDDFLDLVGNRSRCKGGLRIGRD